MPHGIRRPAWIDARFSTYLTGWFFPIENNNAQEICHELAAFQETPRGGTSTCNSRSTCAFV